MAPLELGQVNTERLDFHLAGALCVGIRLHPEKVEREWWRIAPTESQSLERVRQIGEELMAALENAHEMHTLAATAVEAKVCSTANAETDAVIVELTVPSVTDAEEEPPTETLISPVSHMLLAGAAEDVDAEST